MCVCGSFTVYTNQSIEITINDRGRGGVCSVDLDQMTKKCCRKQRRYQFVNEEAEDEEA